MPADPARAPALFSSDEAARCPFHAPSPGAFSQWLETGLQCTAGKREFRLGRYHVATIRGGADYAAGLAAFREEVAAYRRTGYLAIYEAPDKTFAYAEDELWQLGTVMREAGLTRNVASLIAGDTIELPFDVVCPVTDRETTYSFFPVAFAQNAANPTDPLYDPALSAPFTAINTTSDAFAFALLVREQTLKVFERPPREVDSRAALEPVFRKCVSVWQNMSASTIQAYGKVATADPLRAVSLSEDRRFWYAPHNDPVFAELEKERHRHEMPALYAQRLCDRWLATLFEGEVPAPAREGQSGGIPALQP